MRAVTMQDLTARRATETALHESDERLRSAMNAARMGSWEWLVERDEISWSPQMYLVFGAVRVELRWQLPFVPRADPPGRSSARATEHRSVLARRERRGRVRIPRARQRWRAALGSRAAGKPFATGRGKTVRMAGTSTDTTRRHELEEQLLHSQRMEATGRLAAELLMISIIY